MSALPSALVSKYDPDQRAELAIEIQGHILQDNPVIVFYHPNLSMITKSNVEGLVSHPTDFYQVTN